MKKQLLLTLSLISAFTFAIAQIPNASFENWTGDDPDGWFTGNNSQFQFVTKSTTAHDGSFAAQCNVIDFLGNAFSAPFALGSNGLGVHTSTAPQAIHGWFMFNSVGNDSAYGSVGMYDNNGEVLGAGGYLFGPSSVYKEFVMNVYYTNGTPDGDSLIMLFFIANLQTELPHIGSNLVLDDLTFGPLSGIGNVTNTTQAIETVSPNPAGETAEIIYNIHTPGNTSLGIYDVNGRLIQTLVNERQSPGRYKAVADISNLAVGTYFCRLVTDSFAQACILRVSR